jgi:hypothetical protein
MFLTRSTIGRLLMVVLCTGAVLAAAAGPARATPITITSTQPQPDFNQQLFQRTGPRITQDPFDFTGSDRLMSLSRVELTFTLGDGDTDGEEESDYNDLFVKREDADALSPGPINGFPNEQVETETFSWDVTDDPQFSGSLLEKVGPGGDGLLWIRLWDSDAHITEGKNRIKMYPEYDATLKLTGIPVPEPATMGLFLAALAGGGAAYVLRRGRSRTSE